jgi:hypothetical protein
MNSNARRARKDGVMDRIGAIVLAGEGVAARAEQARAASEGGEA